MISIPHGTVELLALVVLALVLHSVLRASGLKWWHFISTKGSDGKHYADIDKLGKVTGIIFGSYVVVTNKSDATLLFVYLSYVGAVGGWSAYLRSRNGSELPAKPETPKP